MNLDAVFCQVSVYPLKVNLLEVNLKFFFSEQTLNKHLFVFIFKPIFQRVVDVLVSQQVCLQNYGQLLEQQHIANLDNYVVLSDNDLFELVPLLLFLKLNLTVILNQQQEARVILMTNKLVKVALYF